MCLYLVLSVYIFQNPNHLPNWYMVKYRENDFIFFFLFENMIKIGGQKRKIFNSRDPTKKNSKIPNFKNQEYS